METTLVVLACAVMGLLIGSFLTVVVDRVPRGASVVQPPSACGACGHRLGPLDLVPIASWVVLGGKCRYCKAKIGIEPIVVEVANAALFVAMGFRFGEDVVVIAFCILSAALVALTWIDLHEFRLPREITYVAMALSAPVLVVAAVVNDEPERIWQAALGALIALAIDCERRRSPVFSGIAVNGIQRPPIVQSDANALGENANMLVFAVGDRGGAFDARLA